MEDKYLIAVCFILIGYLFYKQCQQTESMGNLDSDQETQVKNLIYKTYNIDVSAIRNLSEIATQLQKDGLTIPGNLSVQGTFNYLPKGIIVAWSGTVAPAGWALCDGKKYGDLQTPDLRGRFIRMFSDNITGERGFLDDVIAQPIISSFNKEFLGISRSDQKSWIYKLKLNDQGGTDHIVLDQREMPTHSHTMEIAGEHQHLYEVGDGGFPANGWKATIITDRDHDIKNTQVAGNHIHTINPSGGNMGHNNIPPFFVLAYIIKL